MTVWHDRPRWANTILLAVGRSAAGRVWSLVGGLDPFQQIKGQSWNEYGGYTTGGGGWSSVLWFSLMRFINTVCDEILRLGVLIQIGLTGFVIWCAIYGIYVIKEWMLSGIFVPSGPTPSKKGTRIRDYGHSRTRQEGYPRRRWEGEPRSTWSDYTTEGVDVTETHNKCHADVEESSDSYDDYIP